MEKKQVFISYKSEEFDEALAVKTILEENGISCWMAPMCITGGSSYASEIPAAINNCTVFVLILSNIVQTSKWVPRELDQAINANKTIMPFMLENCPLNDEFSFYLSNVQRYHAYIDREASIEKMLREIKNKLGMNTEKKEAEPTAQPEAEKLVPEEKKDAPITSRQPEKKPSYPSKPRNNKKETVRKSPKNKAAFLVIGIAALLICVFAGMIAGIVALINGTKVDFAGETFKKSAYSITVEDKIITQADLDVLLEFKDLGSIRFINCTLEAQYLKNIAEHSLASLEIVNCGLTNDQLKSIDFKKLDRLYTLNISFNKGITDISCLSPLKDVITELNIGDTSVNGVNIIAGFTKLKILNINNLGISELTPLSKLVYLEYISANGNGLTSLDGLENTTVLSEVSFNNNSLTDVSVLASSAAVLKTVRFDNNNLTDLSPLADCTNIVTLSANNNFLTALDWSGKWTSLSTLSLSGNAIDGLDGMVQSQSLSYLDLSGNKLTEVKGIVFKAEGNVVADFSNNRITSLELQTDCNYRLLALHGNQLADRGGLAELSGYNVTFDFIDSLDAEFVKAINFTTIYIAGCPDNRIVEMEGASVSVKLVSTHEANEAVLDYKG